MSKTYFNNAVIGNSRILGCLTDKGELVRLYWPNIDYQQHVEKMSAGIFLKGTDFGTLWLDDSSMQHSQYYRQDTNMLETVCINMEKGLLTVQTDFVLPDRDIMIRRYDIKNIGETEVDLDFVLYSSFITSTPDLGSILFDFRHDALIHYKHGFYISISADMSACRFQLGNNAYESAERNELKGYDSIGMMPDGAVSWEFGRFQPGENKLFTLYICASDTLKGVKELTAYSKTSAPGEFARAAESYWTSFIKGSRKFNTGRSDVDNLYKRSLLLFKLMADEKTGGLLASPEIDENFTRCGRYAYCWGRDAAFITDALDRCGLVDTVDRFYEWAVRTQDEDGCWQQRYFMDGNLAPSWGLQIDETGTLIQGMLRHYESTHNIAFLEKTWDSVKKGMEFLLSFTDEETGLPKPSYDLWEERVGEHAYSSAAVYAGIIAGAEIARLLNADEETISAWMSAAGALKDAIVRSFWREDRRLFLRSVRTRLNPWGSEYSSGTVVIKVNSKEYYRDVTLEDGIVDVSILGLAIPFGVFDVDDYRIECTVGAIERTLTSTAGGIRRYENDGYIGGNPWIMTTLWVALYHIRKKNFNKAREYFEWAVRSRTQLNLLPEQVDRNTGKPAWVIPLTWSHAMFVLVLSELVEAGAL